MNARRATLRFLSRSRRYVLSLKGWRTRIVFWLGAIAVGLAATVFAWTSTYADSVFRRILAHSSWLPWLVTPLGFVGVLWLTRRVFPGTEGSGIPQTIAALGFRDWSKRRTLLSLRIAFGKILMTLLGLASGASIGREGPTVHVGASILYGIGRWAHFPRHDLERGLILAGGAAGIAAAFNTPIAGIMFAIEEMSRSFEQRTSGTLLIAVLIAGVTALALHGNYTYFGTTDVAFDLADWWLILPCGLLGGLLGGTFSTVLVRGSEALAPWFGRFPYRVALVCGLVVAVLGALSGNTVYGTGYTEARELLAGSDTITPWYPLLKLAGTVASYLSGIPGGIFAPSLSVGAGLGNDIAAWFPATSHAIPVILGMVGYFSGVVQTPITAFVIVLEMTGSPTMVFPTLATSFIAYGVSRLVCRVPIYRALARRFREPA